MHCKKKLQKWKRNCYFSAKKLSVIFIDISFNPETQHNAMCNKINKNINKNW